MATPQAIASVPILTNALQIKSLSSQQAAESIPVQISGVVTYVERPLGLAYIQDETAGVMVRGPQSSPFFNGLEAGQRVSVSGVAAPSDFAPMIQLRGEGLGSQIELLGADVLPHAQRLSDEELQTGSHDGQWIEMSGVIRALKVDEFFPAGSGGTNLSLTSSWRIRMALNTAAGHFTVVCPWERGQAVPDNLLDAQVRIRGVLGSIVNNQGQWVGLLIYVPSLKQIHIEKSRRGDPFSLPPQDVSRLLKFLPEGRVDQRVRVRGAVLLAEPSSGGIASCDVYLKSETGCLLARGIDESGLKVGEVLDASGYPSLENGRVVLNDTLFRRTGTHVTNTAISVTAAEVFKRDLHAELVRLKGRLVQNTVRGSAHLLILDSEGVPVEVTLPKTKTTSAVAKLRVGSVVELTGLAKVFGVREWSGHVRLLSFSLTLRSPADIRVLSEPPWWTPGRLLGLIGLLVVLVALASLWVLSLRRRVAAQTQIIRQNLEKEAIWEERSRIARDLHDDVGASLTQISLLGEMARQDQVPAERVQHQVQKITDKAREAVRSLDEIVWTVNPRNDSLSRTTSYLCHAIQDVTGETGIRCRLRVPDELPAGTIGAKARHHLFLAVKEAVGNIMKHSGAGEILVELAVEDGQLKVCITDNGCGFDVASASPNRNGLGNMERRLTAVGGRCRLESRPGNGTQVTFEVPFSAQYTSNEG